MASDLLVIMGATEEHGTMPLYCKQLKDAGIDFHVHNGSDKPNANAGGNLGYRVNVFRSLVTHFQHYEKIIFSDAFDVTFYGTKEEVIAKIPTTHLLHAAEKNCYPPESCALPIPERGSWRYANGGLVAGTPEQFLQWCDYVPTHHAYNPSMLDQHFLNILVSEQSMFCEIDHRTELYFCLYGGYDELEFENGKPINTIYGTTPLFVHQNGKWNSEEMFAKHERSLR